MSLKVNRLVFGDRSLLSGNMACGATLKRTHEFDSLHSPGRSPKRICGELISSPKPQCPNYSHPQAFVEAANKLANGKIV